MTTLVNGVVLRRANVTTLTANVSNVTSAYVTGLGTANVVVSGAGGQLLSSTITTTELGYLGGVSSSIQSQLDTKMDVGGSVSTIVANSITVSNLLTLTGQVASRALVTDASKRVVTSTTTATEVGYLSGVTSAIQTQLDAKQATITGAATTITTADLSVSKALVSDASGKVANSAVTATELGYLAGVTSAIQTQLSAKQATITGAATTITTADLVASRAVTTNASGKIDVSCVTTIELGYLSGATANVQWQLNNKQATITGAATTIALSDLTASRTLVSDATGKVAVSSVTSVELGYVSGVTSAIQTQLGAKQATITGAATTITASDLTASKALVSDVSGKVAVSAATATEVGYLAGVTSAIQTQLNAKQASVTGGAGTITTADLTVSKALVSDASGKVANSVVTTTELGYLTGVTSALQTQLNAKQATITGGATTITTADLTASKALVSDASGKVAVSTVTTTELGYLSGVTSAVQTQLNAKASSAAPTFTGSVTIQGNLVVLGNTVTINTDQMTVQDPVMVLNTGKLAQPTGLYMQQSTNANIALLFQNNRFELLSTSSEPNATTYTATAYLPLVTGNLTAAGITANATTITGNFTVLPVANGFMSTMGTYDAATDVHTIPASAIDVASSGSGVYAGQLMVFVTNGLKTGSNKTGYAAISLINSPPDFDVVPISLHKNVNLGTFDVGKSTTGANVVVITDADCQVSWKFDGCTVR